MTKCGRIDSLDTAKALGARYILRKPFSNDELMTVVDAALREQPGK